MVKDFLELFLFNFIKVDSMTLLILSEVCVSDRGAVSAFPNECDRFVFQNVAASDSFDDGQEW